jgi:hypothetical protein
MAEYKVRKKIAYDEPKYVRNRWILDMFNKYETYYRTEMHRMITNQRMFWGVNFGQWPAYAVEKLIAQGRKPPTFNMLAKKIESKIGSYLANGFDIKYEARSGKNSHWATSLMDMMYDDKSTCDWETSEIIALRDMGCMVGYERMLISEQNDSDFGDIAFEPLPPTHIFLDPSWKSPYVNDIRNYIEYGDYSVSKICEMFPGKADHLRDIRMREEVNGMNFGEFMGGVQRYRTSEEKWGDFHRVITFHYVDTVDREWEYDLINRCPFPETSYDQGTEKDRMIKMEYMSRMGLTSEDVTTIKQKRKIKRLEAICPTLDNEMFLASGKDRIQTNNCNIYPIGNSFYGQFRGDVDDLADVQISFNKTKMNVEDIISRSAKGAFVLDKALTGGDDRVRQEIEDNWNNPAARLWVDEGTTAELGPHGGIIPLPSHPPSPEMFKVQQDDLYLADWLSTMPSAMDSRSESSSESGKLYQSKVQMGLITQKYGMKIYERHKKAKAQAYPLQAKITYAGYPREFKRIARGEKLLINQPAIDENNRRIIINDISLMPEMSVSLTPAASGTNLRTELRSKYTETLPLLVDPNDRLLKLIMIKNIFGTYDLQEEEKEELKRACDLLLNLTASQLVLAYNQIEQQTQQRGIVPQIPPNENAPQISEGKFDEKKAIQATPQDNRMSAIMKNNEVQ